MNNHQTKILITGGAGFIGKHLVRLLAEHGYNLTSLNREHGDIRSINLFKLGHFDHIIHLANRNFIPDSWNYPGDFFSVNIDGTRNILEYCRVSSAKCVFISAYVYGLPQQIPIPETHSCSALNPYMKSKIIAENLVQYYSDHLETNVTTLRPFNIYGNGQRSDFVIPTILSQLNNNTSQIKVQNTKPKRDFLHVKDFVSSILAVIEHPKTSGNTYNVGSGKSYSVFEIIKTIEEIIGKPISINSEEKTRKNEVMDVVADISKIENSINWKPSLSLSDGLSLTISEQF